MSPDRRGRPQSAWAYALTVLLLAAGVAMTLLTEVEPNLGHVPMAAVLAVLVPLYYATYLRTLDYELRGEAHCLTLVQLPLALGVQTLAPLVHLGARMAVSVAYVLRQRQSPVKALYNIGTAAFEVGAAALAVSLAGPGAGPSHWLALYLGLLVGDLVGGLALGVIWRLLGLEVDRSSTIGALTAAAPVTLLFTAVAIVAVSALRADPWTGPVMVLLAGGLGLAYRAHRQTVSQQDATQQLYKFVNKLGPLTLHGPEMLDALERSRLLLNAEQLDLAVHDGQGWQHALADIAPADQGESHDGAHPGGPIAEPLTSSPTGDLEQAMIRRGGHGQADSMTTPLLGTDGLVGILTATRRLGQARKFDMRDLFLLETIGKELSTALERGRLLTDLSRAATTDTLTGLPNRPDFLRLLGVQLALHPGGTVLAAVAVDSFRDVNDTLGHEVGDELLLEVSRRLTRALPLAALGRIGGGRFAVAVPADLAGGDAEVFGLGIRAQVEGSAQLGAVGTHVKLSVGVLSSPDHGSDPATLVRRAETAMYGARHVNGGPVLWAPAYEVEGTRRLAIVSALREALAGGAIGVAFQPKLQTISGQVTGVEALARWTHPALGFISPDEFIPLAEKSGLMAPLTATVLRQSLVACKGWQRRASRIGVAVNVSADTVLDPAFVSQVAAILTSVGLAPDLLTLELTEGVVVHDPALAVIRMGELRNLGVRLSVDDFGTGYSSLNYLKGLPVDEVKIDKSFIDEIAVVAADRAVVRAVVDIAHTLELRVVAEGVEQQEQLDVLRLLGVDEVQGFLHAHPMPALEVSAWLRRRHSEVYTPVSVQRVDGPVRS